MAQNFEIKNYFIISVITFFIFFWGANATIGINFDFRYVILLIFIFLIKDIAEDCKKKNYKFFYLSFSIFLFLITHGFFSRNILNFNFFLSIIFILYLFNIAYYYHNLILENKKNIIVLFVAIFFITIFFTYFQNLSHNPEPFSCGALKNFLPGKNDFSSNYFLIHFISSYEFLFQENSHFAMVSVSVIIFSLYLIIEKKISIYLRGILILFILVSILKISATLVIGLSISSIVLVLFEYKRISHFLTGALILLSIILLSIFFNDVVCIKKINPTVGGNNILNNYNFNKNLFANSKSTIFSDGTIVSNNDSKSTIFSDGTIVSNNEGSTSAVVFYHALNVTINSFLEKPLGWGFQGYEFAHSNYNINDTNLITKQISNLNTKDGTNNFFKIITEFGVFGFIIYFVLAFVLINKNVSVENKIFLFPFLITQSVRGAGYFNGGFILIMFVLLILEFKKK
jgi:hypothetical protein